MSHGCRQFSLCTFVYDLVIGPVYGLQLSPCLFELSKIRRGQWTGAYSNCHVFLWDVPFPHQVRKKSDIPHGKSSESKHYSGFRLQWLLQHYRGCGSGCAGSVFPSYMSYWNCRHWALSVAVADRRYLSGIMAGLSLHGSYWAFIFPEITHFLHSSVDFVP